MRNALVLVPLCIGLSSGFIVTTGTAEVYKFTKKTSHPKREVMILLDDDNSKKETNNSVKTGDSLLYDDVEDKIKKELYNQGVEEDKNINERSFVFVNQRWKKVPTKTHLVDTKPGSPNLNRSSVLNVFEETSVDTAKNIATKIGNANTKYVDERQKENKTAKSKNYFPLMYQHKGTIQENSNLYSNYRKENVPLKPVIKSFKDINSNGKQNLVDSMISDYIKISKHSNDDKPYFKTISKANNDVQQHNEYKDRLTDKLKSKYEHALFKVRAHEVINDVYENTFSEYNLFQHTLEEQVPDKKRYNDNKLNHLKYCQDCSQKANMRKLNSRQDMECKCKCGRYIRLNGPSHT